MIPLSDVDIDSFLMISSMPKAFNIVTYSANSIANGYHKEI